MSTEIHLNLIDKFFKENSFVEHHLHSVNNFYENDIKKVLSDLNPITYVNEFNGKSKEFQNKIEVYFGGIKSDRIYYGKPILHENGKNKLLFPNEARLRNMTYSLSVHVDIEVYYTIYHNENDSLDTDHPHKFKFVIEHYHLGNFPIMVNSKNCITNGMNSEAKYQIGECRHDYGGYFIIDGKEKALIPQETFANNMMYIREVNDNIHDYSVEIRSISEDESKPKRTLAIRRVAMKAPRNFNQYFRVFIPNVRMSIPLFIVFRALGFTSDKEICEIILGKNIENDKYLEMLIPSVTDAGGVYSQEDALTFIGSFTKEHSNHAVYLILCDYFLPHLGEMEFKSKAFYLGYMVNELINVIMGKKPVTDRDHYRYKRVETSGYLMKELFSEYARIMYKEFYTMIEKEYYYHKEEYSNPPEYNNVLKELYPEKEEDEYIDIGSAGEIESDIIFDDVKYPKILKLIINNHPTFFQDKIINKGFRTAFKGNWGAYAHTKRLGVIQDLNRLSYNSFISHLRKINLNIDPSAKIVGPHLLHGTQYGIIDPVDTPDGGNVGFHKHMAFTARITHKVNGKYMKKWLTRNMNTSFTSGNSQNDLTFLPIEEINYKIMNNNTKVFIDGVIVGVTNDPLLFQKTFKHCRRLNLIPIYASIQHEVIDNYIYIFCDEGRLVRPLLYFKNGVLSYKYNYETQEISVDETKTFHEKVLEDDEFTWRECIYSFQTDLYKGGSNNKSFIDLKRLDKSINDPKVMEKMAILDFIDKSEEENSYIVSQTKEINIAPGSKNPYTHAEIHPSLMFGVMGNLVIFPEHNQLPRDLFSCGQSKQAVSLYHSNYHHRIDKMGVVLNNGEIPLVKSMYLDYINGSKHPYGQNTIVAIMCHGGYNVEDSILFNKGSVDRGLFLTTYYNSYQTFEESSEISKGTSESVIKNVVYDENINIKPGYDYTHLDDNGIIKVNTQMNDKKVVIGKMSYDVMNDEERYDASVYPKKGQLGYVDKVFLSTEEEGKRIAKVRIREQRVPAIGDKFCSRCGQKGTVGSLIPEENMPFTKDGIKPDIIINPHAIPSRMTIGQLVETLMAKLGIDLGSFMDCTAFNTSSDKISTVTRLLSENDYHSKGEEVLYNAMTGEQIEANIFMGPTYYMRLKHMVKDKINYRAQGPRTLLTRQTNHGRANDGGLRIGEMERDGVIAHGCAFFLKDSMMKRGDEYDMAVCNHSGTIAIRDKETNNLYSPILDGPIHYEIKNKDDMVAHKISKFGKEFSIVKIPYSFKLLLQELASMNCMLRLVTNENINTKEELSPVKLEDVLNKVKRIDIQNSIDDQDIEELDDILSQSNKQERDEEVEETDYSNREKQSPFVHIWRKIEGTTTDDYGYVSLIQDEDGLPTEMFFGDDDYIMRRGGNPPDIYPLGWNSQMLIDENISEQTMMFNLKYNQIPNNWDKIIEVIRYQRKLGKDVVHPFKINDNGNVDFEYGRMSNSLVEEDIRANEEDYQKDRLEAVNKINQQNETNLMGQENKNELQEVTDEISPDELYVPNVNENNDVVGPVNIEPENLEEPKEQPPPNEEKADEPADLKNGEIKVSKLGS
jgi:DNA-directed RNA polymerase II subunit RPB2